MYNELAKELLLFLGIDEQIDDDYAYKLQRVNTFLEMKFGNVPEIQKEVESLRQWQKAVMPVVVQWSEIRGGFVSKDDE